MSASATTASTGTNGGAGNASPDWHGIFDSLTDEHDYTVDQIDGRLPAELRGTLYRNGPGINEVGGRPFAHLFDGHGMISQFALDGSSVRYRNRFVRTRKYLAERDAGRPAARGFGEEGAGLLRNLFSLPRDANAANTSVTLHGENLLALWEGGRPWALDPDTLATRGEYDFEGELKALHAFSAHPKYDPRTGEMFNFGAEYFPRPRLRCYRVEPAGRLHKLGTVPMPVPVMNHDFALTERHMVFVLDPILIRVGTIIRGGSIDRALHWDASKPTCVVLVPRDGGKPRTIETEPFFHFHVNNAFEDRGDTVVDLVRYDDYSIGENSLREFRSGGFDEPAALWRLRVKPSGEVERHELCSWQCEFPQHDWRRTTLGYRYAYLAGRPEPGGGPVSSVIKVDHETGRSLAHVFGEADVAGEPIFVPHSADAGEDEGWLLSVVYSAAEHRSRLVVLDARDPEAEPVAVAHLRHHVPLGFHGTFTRRVAAPGDG
jgi:all-trans-8'-apo-beta-carotenal 15,15'-oxygenase